MSVSVSIPDNFKPTVVDFTRDLSTTFPEYSHLWSKWSNSETTSPEEYESLFRYCMTVFPERFFDIIYQKDELFSKDSQVNTFFLPEVDFKLLYNCEDLTNHTKKTIWKYLQLILLIIAGTVKDKSDFGESTKLFDCIDENELQDKLKDTLDGISKFFSNLNTESSKNADPSTTDSSVPSESESEFTFDKQNSTSGPTLPNLEELHEQLKGLFDGKIGGLAKELAEEISGEFSNILGEDTSDMKSTNDVLKKVMQNPAKMMGLVKTVGDKLKTKMASGQISQEELMREATEIMQKMKGMGEGNGQFEDILKSMMKGMGKGMMPGMNHPNPNQNQNTKQSAKVDVGAMGRITEKMKSAERMRNKLLAKKNMESLIQPSVTPNNFTFRIPGEEDQERSQLQTRLADEALIAEFEKADVVVNPTKNSNSNQKTQNKKKKKKN
jgi:hypothetical protein